MYQGEEDNLVPTSDRYKRHFPELLIAHMAKGFTFESFAGIANVSVGTIKLWRQTYPDFDAAADIGHAHCMLYWEAIGRAAIIGKFKNFREKTYITVMQKLFNYAEKQEVEHTGKLDIRVYIPHNNRDPVEAIYKREQDDDQAITADVLPAIESRPRPESLVLESIGSTNSQELLPADGPLPDVVAGGLSETVLEGRDGS